MSLYASLPEPQKHDLISTCVAELSYQRFGTRTPYYVIAGQMRREVIAVLKAADTFFQHRTDRAPR